MFHSYFYTPFMDASCAISVLSALLRRLQFNAVVCACRAIWKGETALQEMLPARQTIAKSPCRRVFNANPGFEYRSNFFPLFLFFFLFLLLRDSSAIYGVERNNWTLSSRSYELHENTLRKFKFTVLFHKNGFFLDLFFNNIPFFYKDLMINIQHITFICIFMKCMHNE